MATTKVINLDPDLWACPDCGCDRLCLILEQVDLTTLADEDGTVVMHAGCDDCGTEIPSLAEIRDIIDQQEDRRLLSVEECLRILNLPIRTSPD